MSPNYKTTSSRGGKEKVRDGVYMWETKKEVIHHILFLLYLSVHKNFSQKGLVWKTNELIFYGKVFIIYAIIVATYFAVKSTRKVLLGKTSHFTAHLTPRSDVKCAIALAAKSQDAVLMSKNVTKH